MKKWMYMGLAAALLHCGCTKEGRIGSAEGTLVLFSAATAETRTVYSGSVTGGYERIDWVNGDQITIKSLQTTPASATYTVGGKQDSGKQSVATSVTSSAPLQWGAGSTHDFFSVYPSTAELSISGTTATVTGSIPATQNGAASNLSTYGYMYASKTASAGAGTVNLAFRPMFNTVQFSLKAADATIADKTLSSIQLISDDNLAASSFTATFGTGTTSLTSVSATSGASKTVTVSASGKLSTATARTVTFFTLPTQQRNLKLKLNFSDNTSRTLTLKNSSGTAYSMNAGDKLVFSEISVPKKIVHVTGVTLNQSALNMTVGGANQTLTATVAPTDATDKSVSWSSSNTSVATVTNGVVHAVGAGTATITVTTTDGSKTATCTVTVTQPVSGVSVSPTSATLNVGGTQQLTATVSPSTASNQNVTWSSSNTSVATVSNTGLVTAVAAGSATITVRTSDGGYTATCSVTVNAPEPNPYLFTFKSGSETILATTSATDIFAIGSDYVTSKPFNPSGGNWSIANSALNSPYGEWVSLEISFKKTLTVTKIVINADGANGYGLVGWIKVAGDVCSSPSNGSFTGNTNFTWTWSGKRLSSISISTLSPFKIHSIEVTYQ
jgi:uncharacterized protein YjdB